MAEKSQPPTTGPRRLPSPSAPAEEVRAYITHLLVTKYNTPADIAEKHASKWEIGTFSQFVKASQQSLSDIFNTNVALCLGSALQDDMSEYVDEQPSVIVAKYTAYISAVVLAAILSLAFSSSLGLPTGDDRPPWALSPFPWFIFSGSTAYYAYKQGLSQSRTLFCVVSGYFTFIVGICIFLAS